MRRVPVILISLLLGASLVIWIVFFLVQRTAQDWAEQDIKLRSQLAVNTARRALIARWHKERQQSLENLLVELTEDERILAAAACSDDLELLANTPGFPTQFSCAEIGPHLRNSSDSSDARWSSWQYQTTVDGGPVSVTGVPVHNGPVAVGFVILIYDLGYVHRQEAKLGQLVVFALVLLTATLSLVTVVAVRLSRRRWSDEFRRFLRGDALKRPEFQPILHDVRELVDRIIVEEKADWEGGGWTPQRLKQTLSRYLHGEKVVILANREPYIHERNEDGSISVMHPASGLVTALEPVMQACTGVWVAHGSGSADRETSDRDGRILVPPDQNSYVLRRVWLSKEEEDGYYYGFANEGLWPLCHIAHTRPMFRHDDWNHYRNVNERFANAVCAEVDSEDPIVLVQDYHFALAPRLIRERLPRATVMTFWHIPWPNAERFGICPWSKELLDGLLGSSLLGFHTQIHCNNFMDSVDRFLEARVNRELSTVTQQGSHTQVRPYPISLEWPIRWLKTTPPPSECREEIFHELKLRSDALLGVGVDRLDYTKGIEERLLTVERLLERYPEFRGRFTFVQLAAPSRSVIQRYRQLDETVAQVAARINERFGKGIYRPIVLLRAHHEPPTVFRYYRAADLCYVSSLHDGMNLVAKEFVASREDERGVLLLSQFTGAATELAEALIVNPYDLEGASSAFSTALRMSIEEQRDRMRSMRSFLSEFNVYRWAGRMLVDCSRIRRQDRLSRRLTDHTMRSVVGSR
jgi:trehalose-6-phosphate synthase